MPPEAAADPWPDWARPQLLAAAALADQVCAQSPDRPLARELYRRWYSPTVGPSGEFGRSWPPLVGTYRAAHAGSGSRILADGIALVDRHDALGPDRWWRTWGPTWAPIESRRNSVRVLLSPHPGALAEFVGTVTAALMGSTTPWLLACTADVGRLRRSGSAVLCLPDVAALPRDLLDLLRPVLRPATPPLCLPLAPGAALVADDDGAAGFGRRRCQLIALALHGRAAQRSPLTSIAEVFGSHGIDPGAPYRSATG